MATIYREISRVFKALGDENCLHILEMLRTGEKCACKLLDELHITQSTLSHHMKILCDAEIVAARKDGKWVHYYLEQFRLLKHCWRGGVAWYCAQFYDGGNNVKSSVNYHAS